MVQDEASAAFIALFKEAYAKCFGVALYAPASETESRHLSNTILQETGLVIGAKSLKNYAAYALHPFAGKAEKPSFATLDTLARYVLNAAYLTEAERKEKESHHPYWFKYRNTFAASHIQPASVSDNPPKQKTRQSRKQFIIAGMLAMILIAAVIIYSGRLHNGSNFTDDFTNTDNDSLQLKGWALKSVDSTWWNHHNEIPLRLTLYTLPGDSWGDSLHKPGIKNVLFRKIPSSCFTAEIHLDSFVPMHEWQQAGIILSADTNFTGETLRVSLAFNDFFGGYQEPREIIIQAINSTGNHINNPEEFIHLHVFSIEPGQEMLVAANLRKSALRIEKINNHFRFLYGTGQADNFAFKEAFNKDISFEPKYIGIFAIEGFVSSTDYLPARFSYFSLQKNNCK